MSGLDAAHTVLRKHGKPMNARDITKAVFAQGLWQTSGKTPWATIASAMLREIKAGKGDARFCRAGRGLFESVKGDGTKR